ncbi:ACT domain-containing protein [Aestuariibacter salexigens]|uniref:ACT domain-containing protein n=1 Tax=Aestuariibacter salexigens TaxID=226010 RepID=UPI000418528B|nr:ACT domain-containing protein [Aestuariibacter salexigens]
MSQAIKALDQLISSMQPDLHAQPYVYCCLEAVRVDQVADLQPLATINEVEGMTLIIPLHIAEDRELTYQGPYAAITLNVHSSLDAVGLTAAVAGELAKHEISANMLAGFYHDHILVGWDSRHQAMSALQGMMANR